MKDQLPNTIKQPSSDSLIRKIESAHASIRIKDCQDEAIAAVLNYVFTLLGIPERNEPDQKNKAVILAFIRGFWQHMPLEELKLAFELALDKKFNVKLNLYDRPFNVEFMSKVITAYREFTRAQTTPHLKPVPQLPSPESTPEQMYISLTQYIHHNKKIPLIWAWDTVFDYMETAGILKDTLDEKKLFAQSIMITVKNEADQAKQKRGKHISEILLKELQLGSEEFKARCRKERVIHFMINNICA